MKKTYNKPVADMTVLSGSDVITVSLGLEVGNITAIDFEAIFSMEV